MKFVSSRWSLSLIGTVSIAGLAWWFSPLLPPFEDPPLRIALILLILLLWAVANLLLELRRRGRDAALASGLTAAPAAARNSEEAEALREKLKRALDVLKRTRGSRGYLYELPWYAIIGPPGAGKTTALLNAGLHFPLAEEMGQGALSGVGGTRLCEWWFTDHAVLIDTAGRYTTQDSNAGVDRAGWEQFLSLLRRTRPRQPLNGVIVAIALSDLARGSAEECASHAGAIRQRLQELEARLGVRLPVYALFTKADLIAGFTEFFDDLDQEGRGQVWGITFGGPERGRIGGDGPLAEFVAEFRALRERLQPKLFERSLAEPNPDKRALITLFPGQIASLEQRLDEFLRAAFGGQAPAFLRGVYITSGTQEGTPIDRLVGALSRSFGLGQKRLPSARPGQGRSYFLTRLLRDVIFNEAMLVSLRPRAARRRWFLRTAQFAIAALIVAAAGILLWRIDDAELRGIEAARASLRAYEQTAGTMALDPVAGGDLTQLAPLLDQARLMASEDAEPPQAWCCLGLAQHAKLLATGRAVYRHALEFALLPRLIWRLEAQMSAAMNQPDLLYEATRVYLMLGGSGPLDRGLVHAWMELDWQAAYPVAAQQPLRQSLLQHLDDLLLEPLPAVTLDGGLLSRARSTFGRVTLAERAYSRVRPSAAAQRLAPWRPGDALGPAGAALMLRSSGKSLDDGVPGFYTIEGFHTVLLPAADSAASRVASESWVLGQKIELDAGGTQLRALRREMIALYEADYARTWDEMLGDLNIRPMKSLPRAAQDLYILASPQSPMRFLLASIARQLRLSVPPSPAAAAALPDADPEAERLRVLLGGGGPASAAAPGQEIDERYKALLALFGDGASAPIDLVLKSLIDIQQSIAKQAAAPPGSAAPSFQPGNDPAQLLLATAARQPAPLSRWLTTIANSAISLRGGN